MTIYLSKMARQVLVALTTVTLIVLFTITPPPPLADQLPETNIPIDVVYTWVNGSDPQFIRQLSLYLNRTPTTENQSTANRYNDNDELKYSLRSLEKNAPWVRRVYIVTNGQVPNWINLNNSRVRLISHEEIFPNRSHLPTFSSPAIEAHLHRIGSLSSMFLYINDDILLTAPIYPQDFFTFSNGLKIRLYWPLSTIRSDEQLNLYDSSLLYVNRLFDKIYRKEETSITNSTVKKVAHIPLLIDREIMSQLVSRFPKEFERTSSNRFRSGTDMQFAFSYSYFILNEDKWSYEIDETDETWDFVSVGSKHFQQQLSKIKKKKPKKFLCLNDDIDYTNTDEARVLRRALNQFYEQSFPHKSQFEI